MWKKLKECIPVSKKETVTVTVRYTPQKKQHKKPA